MCCANMYLLYNNILFTCLFSTASKLYCCWLFSWFSNLYLFGPGNDLFVFIFNKFIALWWNTNVRLLQLSRRLLTFAEFNFFIVIYCHIMWCCSLVFLPFVHIFKDWFITDVIGQRATFKGCLGGERTKGQMWNGPNIKTKDHNYQQKRLTGSRVSHIWHFPTADVDVERGSTKKGCCVLGGGRRKGQMWNGPNKNNKGTTTINNWQEKTYFFPCLSLLTRPTGWCWRWTL